MALAICIKNAVIILDTLSFEKQKQDPNNQRCICYKCLLISIQHVCSHWASSIAPNQTADNTDELEFLVEQDNDR